MSSKYSNQGMIYMKRAGFVSVGCVLAFLLVLLKSNSLAAQEYSLEDFYRFALERAERIKLSEEDLYIAEKAKDKALAGLLPTLSAFGNYTRYTENKISSTGSVIQPNTSTAWGVRLDQSFSLSGRELTAFKISNKNIERSEYDLYAVRESYLYSVASAYYDVLRSKKAVEIAKANIERLTKHRDAAAIRLKVGEVTKTALLRAEAELSGAQSEEIKAKNSLALARAVLARVVGINESYDVKETEDSSQHIVNIQGAETIESFKQVALSERAELKSLGLQKKIEEEQVKYTRGSYWPTLSIEGVYSRNEDDPASTFLNRESIYGGLTLNFSFYEGGLRKAEVREAEAKLRQTELIYEDLKKTINIDVESAYLDIVTQKGVLKSLEDQVMFARDNYNAISRQFEFGLANSVDVMDANTLLVTAERQLADARYNYQLSVLRLKRATGTLLKAVYSKQ